MEELLTTTQLKLELPITLVSTNDKVSTNVWKGTIARYLLLQKGISQEALSSSKCRGNICKKSLECIWDDGSEWYVHMQRMLNPAHDVILAHETNGELFSYNNGFPGRFIVPGHVASHSIEWIKTINIVCSKEEDAFDTTKT